MDWALLPHSLAVLVKQLCRNLALLLSCAGPFGAVQLGYSLTDILKPYPRTPRINPEYQPILTLGVATTLPGRGEPLRYIKDIKHSWIRIWLLIPLVGPL